MTGFHRTLNHLPTQTLQMSTGQELALQNVETQQYGLHAAFTACPHGLS